MAAGSRLIEHVAAPFNPRTVRFAAGCIVWVVLLEIAPGGGKDPSRLDEALAKVKSLLPA